MRHPFLRTVQAWYDREGKHDQATRSLSSAVGGMGGGGDRDPRVSLDMIRMEALQGGGLLATGRPLFVRAKATINSIKPVSAAQEFEVPDECIV